MFKMGSTNEIGLVTVMTDQGASEEPRAEEY